MQDRLKQYVEEQRDAFEVYQPREHLWKEIDERLQHRRRGAILKWVDIAASVMLFITCGTWLFIANRQDAPAIVTHTGASAPLVEAEAYYTAIVRMKDAEMEQYCQPQPELCREFENDIAALNEAYYQLKREYAVSANKKTILQAMMTNLQMQVQMINRQIQIMETVKQKKEEIRII